MDTEPGKTTEILEVKKYWKLYKRRYRIDAEQEAYQIIENGK